MWLKVSSNSSYRNNIVHIELLCLKITSNRWQNPRELNSTILYLSFRMSTLNLKHKNWISIKRKQALKKWRYIPSILAKILIMIAWSRMKDWDQLLMFSQGRSPHSSVERVTISCDQSCQEAPVGVVCSVPSRSTFSIRKPIVDPTLFCHQRKNIKSWLNHWIPK